MSTEARNPRSYGLDRMTGAEIVRLMNEEEYAVLRALQNAEAAIALTVERAAKAFQDGGRIVYVGAGTSGRLCHLDAAEMTTTFGLDYEAFTAVVAGGLDPHRSDEIEDDEHAAVDAINSLRLDRQSIVIGVAASGRTPFTIAALRHASQKGLWTCAIVNNPSAPLKQVADHTILLDTGPEILTGSTRLKAGTAQKLALERISTGAMVLSGKTIQNLMVDVKPTGHKLRERAVRIVRELSNATADEALLALEANGWNIRQALADLERPGQDDDLMEAARAC